MNVNFETFQSFWELCFKLKFLMVHYIFPFFPLLLSMVQLGRGGGGAGHRVGLGLG